MFDGERISVSSFNGPGLKDKTYQVQIVYTTYPNTSLWPKPQMYTHAHSETVCINTTKDMQCVFTLTCPG